MKTKISKLRLKKIKSLCKGTGEDIERGICVMQAVDYVTTGGLSDSPECACPALTRYAIRLNDKADSETRQKLLPLIPKLVGTRDGMKKERAQFLVHHSITVVLPILVKSLGLDKEASRLSEFKHGEWEDMKNYCNEIKPLMRAAAKNKYAAYAAYAAADAADAAYAAAYAAAAADAAAYAAYAADAAADAAISAAYAASKKVRSDIWDTAFDGLSKACEIKEKKRKAA